MQDKHLRGKKNRLPAIFPPCKTRWANKLVFIIYLGAGLRLFNQVKGPIVLIFTLVQYNVPHN